MKNHMSLILEAWQPASSFSSLGSIITNLRQYLHVDLRNNEGFYKEDIVTFVLKVLGMSELKKGEEYLTSMICIKQLKSCWIKRMKT